MSSSWAHHGQEPAARGGRRKRPMAVRRVARSGPLERALGEAEPGDTLRKIARRADRLEAEAALGRLTGAVCLAVLGLGVLWLWAIALRLLLIWLGVGS